MAAILFLQPAIKLRQHNVTALKTSFPRIGQPPWLADVQLRAALPALHTLLCSCGGVGGVCPHPRAVGLSPPRLDN